MHWTDASGEVILVLLARGTRALRPRSPRSEPPLDNLPILLATGMVAGAINAVGGGGSFIALPVLMALGVSAIDANASLTVALLPAGWATAWAYRSDLRRFDVAPLWPMLAVSGCGGLLGALLLLATPTHAFDAVLPWLVLTATLTFGLGREAGALLGRTVRVRASTLLVIQLFLAVYAGYFGGGVGIMMMSAWSLLATDDVLAMQAARMVMVTTANATAAAWFAVSGVVAWPQTCAVLLAGLVGGYAGARVAQRLRPAHVRRAIVVIGVAITIGLFVRGR